MIELHWLYVLAGAMFAAFALSQRARRHQCQSAGATPHSGR